MPHLFRVGQNTRARPCLQPRQIPRVIEMTVGKQNGFDRIWLETQLAHQPANEERLPARPVSIITLASLSSSKWQQLMRPRIVWRVGGTFRTPV